MCDKSALGNWFKNLPFRVQCHLRNSPRGVCVVSLAVSACLPYSAGSLRLYQSSDELLDQELSSSPPPEVRSPSMIKALCLDRLLKRTNSWSNQHGQSESVGGVGGWWRRMVICKPWLVSVIDRGSLSFGSESNKSPCLVPTNQPT